MPHRDDFVEDSIKSFAAAMIRSRRGVLTEYATLLRFQQGTRTYHRQFDKMTNRVQQFKELLRSQVASHLDKLPGLTFAIWDDSTIRKTGKHFEGEGIHHDHTKGGHYKGFIACSLAIYKHGKVGVLDTVFANKKQTKLEQCNEAFVASCEDIDPDLFIFDSWYGLSPVLDKIEELGKTYVTRFRSNRVACFDDESVSLRELATNIDHKEYDHIRIRGRTFWVVDVTLNMNDIGEQRIIISKDKVHAKPIFLTTNHNGFTTKFVVSIYLKRFAIEVFFKDAKQFLNFETFQCRSQRKWDLHLVFVHLVHWCLQSKHSISKVIRPIRESVDKILSYINRNELFNNFLDGLRTRCQM